MYSERFRVCRLSRSDQKDGRLIYEPDYDYYESLSGKKKKFIINVFIDFIHKNRYLHVNAIYSILNNLK